MRRVARRAARKDLTHAAIVGGLEAVGKVVFDVSSIGGLGFDIVVYDPSDDFWMPLEIKSPSSTHHKAMPSSRPYRSTTRKLTGAASPLTPSELAARDRCGVRSVETLDEALALLAGKISDL